MSVEAWATEDVMTQAAVQRRSRPSVAKTKPRQEGHTDARKWLRESGYADIADMIDEVMAEWEAKGLSTRRSWWQILAGGAHGRPLTIYGRMFPVLASAQRRQRLPVTANALQRNAKETPPPVRTTGRWPQRPGSR